MLADLRSSEYLLPGSKMISCVHTVQAIRDVSAVSLVQFSCLVVSDSLWPHRLQHTRLPCLSPTPRACANSCLSSWWCHPTISSSVVPFSPFSAISYKGSNTIQRTLPSSPNTSRRPYLLIPSHWGLDFNIRILEELYSDFSSRIDFERKSESTGHQKEGLRYLR